MFQPAAVLLEFFTWFVWLLCFGAIQGTICKRFPGIRSVCKRAYFVTMVVPIVGGLFLMLRAGTGSGALMLTALNHSFGAGVFMQTSIRALVLTKWLAVGSLPHPHTSLLTAESDMLALTGILMQMRKSDRRGLANGRGSGTHPTIQP